MIKKLHHNAYRCRDSEQTRAFYEDFPGLPLSGTLAINETKSGRKTGTLHTFYALDDGSYLAFSKHRTYPSNSRISTTSTCISRSKSRCRCWR